MPPRPQPGTVNKKDLLKSKGTLLRVLKYVFQKYAFFFVLVFICIAINAICTARGTLFMQSLIDDYIKPMLQTGSKDFGPLGRAVLKMVVVYSIALLASFGQAFIMIFINQGTLKSLREEMFEKMESLPISYFDGKTRGEVMSMYTNDVDTLRQMISGSVPQIFSSTVTLITTLYCMIRLSGVLTMVSILMVVVVMFVTKFVAGRSGKYFKEQQAALGKVNGNIEEIINGQKVVKVFCHEKQAFEEFDALNNDLCEKAANANIYGNMMGPINMQLGNLSYVIVAVVGGALAITGFTGLTLGSLVSFLTFNKNFSMPINQLSQQINAIVLAMAGAERVFKLIDETPEVDDGYVTLVNAKEVDGELVECEERTGIWAWKHPHQADKTLTYQRLCGEVVFDNVDFGYVPEKQVLYDVNLFAKPGQKIAFVGATGAGKTTITNLINRFYDIDDGKIRYDGINVNKIKKDDLRRSLGIVLQDTHLFTGTVADNIRYGKLDATMDEVVAAAKLANADSFIRKLPEGYDTVIKGDGGSLSQGQRQLLAIARAAIADPPVLILDEATSSIDTHTERLVQDGMDKLMSGRTTFVIAHRLSTIRNSDCIMVLDNGHIIERGSHDELIEKGGKYYQLYTGKIVNA